MKNIVYTLILVIALLGSCFAEEDAEASVFMQQLDMLSIPLSHNGAAVYLGAGYSSSNQQILPGISLSIPFGGSYSILAGIGAAKDNTYNEALSMVHLGIGVWDMFPAQNVLWYAFGASVRNYRAASYNNLAVAVNASLGQSFETLAFAIGLDLSLQHQQIYDSNILAETDERVYRLIPKVGIYSPYVNIELRVLGNAFATSLSWTLNLE